MYKHPTLTPASSYGSKTRFLLLRVTESRTCDSSPDTERSDSPQTALSMPDCMDTVSRPTAADKNDQSDRTDIDDSQPQTATAAPKAEEVLNSGNISQTRSSSVESLTSFDTEGPDGT